MRDLAPPPHMVIAMTVLPGLRLLPVVAHRFLRRTILCSKGSQAGAGPYQPASAPYTSAPYSQPPTSRPYSASSQPPSAGVYGPQPQQQGGPYRPGDERRGSSRTGSPMVTQQQQQQQQYQRPAAAPAGHVVY
ncbi:hypothetical protein DL89DRAFT_52173 [Linderina pennispora]|uniref:Uncharacterized protein n=1 Tax=Linderina pennispora TaxID=61395 RepID=A0A1Y1W0Q3_9FUNG|nr:uncharacterized protein DL89DRAFT_52173 [Linderina pennispora]ORX67103.1 hypothetical protein DL89DRAFT_52173 [Linderina pennispora]